ncbi:galactose-specific lectin nattectin-like [Poecilia formosa]|uniref:galactose-specific lectin nattectin-like n=1 Tax=Poecilia formosa TaxID=48698 RepID=UPI0007B7E0F0|nr:PREDICTED: galactose-specific lectin nattectin-like [Poecilia formosa]
MPSTWWPGFYPWSPAGISLKRRHGPPLPWAHHLSEGPKKSGRPSSPRSSPACPSGWTKYGNRCFYFYNSQMNWASAERACIRLGGNLASIHSSSEHSFLKALVRSKKGSYQRTWVGGHDAVRSDCISLGANLASIHSSGEHIFLKELVNSKKGSYQRTWVGGHDAVKEGVWLWSDGSKFDYTKWGSGEPNNLGGKEHCMEINIAGSTQHLNDEVCSRNRFSICAKNL